MEVTVEPFEIKIQGYAEDKELHSLEEVFDRIDNKFINVYGEYGRRIVNDRRIEWNQDKIVNLKLL